MRAFAPCSAGITTRGDNEISVGNLRLNVTRRPVWLGETALDLTPKEYALLSRLMMKAGSPVHREILYNDIYSWDNEPATNTTEVHIHNLRERLANRGSAPSGALAICWLTTSTRNRPWLCLQLKLDHAPPAAADHRRHHGGLPADKRLLAMA